MDVKQCVILGQNVLQRISYNNLLNKLQETVPHCSHETCLKQVLFKTDMADLPVFIHTAWAIDFETPVGSSTFFSFFFFLGSIGRNKQ
jgi:hypothetical protein